MLLTHGHPDHYAAAGLFEKAQILVGPGDLSMIRGDKTHHSTFGRIMSAVMPLPQGPAVVRELRATNSWSSTALSSGSSQLQATHRAV